MSKNQADQNKQNERLLKQQTEDAARLTEFLVEKMNQFAANNGLTPEQVVFGVALMTINMRETAPKGKDWFDENAAIAADYYAANKDK